MLLLKTPIVYPLEVPIREKTSNSCKVGSNKRPTTGRSVGVQMNEVFVDKGAIEV